MRLYLFFFLLLSVPVLAQNQFPAPGFWREHLPYKGAIDVTASDQTIYAATPYSLFSVDIETKEVERFSKVSGLSETGVSSISYDPVSKKLFISYSNSNVDVLDANGIHNIPDIKRTNISGDKNIYHIYPADTRCYLSTGLGIIVLDAVKYEVKESWFIGNSGGFVKTNAFTIANGYYYAATDEGLKRTPATNPNPADFQNWQLISGINGLADTSCSGVVSLQNKVFALQNDSVFVENGGNWDLFFSNNISINSISASENKILVSQQIDPSSGQVIVLDTNGSLIKTISQPGIIAFPRKAISVNNDYWVADQYAGLSRWTQGSTTAVDIFQLNSPNDIATGQLTVYNDIFYAAAGGINDSWNYLYNRGGIFRLGGGEWTAYNQYVFPQLDTVLDFIAIAIDPRDESIWAGSFGGGLVHFTSTGLEIYKQNSPIGPAIGDPSSYRISGLAFDMENNLWISNYGAGSPLVVLKNDGSWQSFTIPFLITENATAQIVIDEANQKWIISPKGNGLILFNDNHTIDNPGDDQWRLYRMGTGSGNLPSNDVLSIAKDKSGFIWVGTSDGIGVIQCPEAAFIQGCEAIRPVIKEGGFANYLFKGEQVRSIAVDGADRKWVATSDGVWLVSPDGDKVLEHFTESNSHLLSNDVKSIAINGKTGEVFFATARGISSYRGTATETSETKNDVLVFPNPVTPGYNGNIAIRGLPENSTVKILETGGRLVFQTRALGGQAIWNGRDYKNNKAATGIYLVIAVDDKKEEKVVAKIVVVN